ncbi:Pre-mRNA-splicing factor Cwf15/Cwc15 [Phakopsora pachyrhizi]|nr:Pre-mRNA-splicing factor Cwf15/Cwc15 [Phakopsora pachyrhizi]
MSSAHRPTWAPAMGKDARMNTKQYSSRDIAAHTNLKFRKPGQNSRSDLSRRDLRLELELAESRARALKRKQAGLLPLPEDEDEGERSGKTPSLKQITGDEKGSHHRTEEEEKEEEDLRMKRRRILEQALLIDKDDSDSEDDDDDDDDDRPKRVKSSSSTQAGLRKGDRQDDQIDADREVEDEDDDSDDDSDDDEAETAELMKELEKIKRERAEEKARQEREAALNSEIDKETKAAIGNPLLNLKAALNNSTQAPSSPTNSISSSMISNGNGSFLVKRRWDDDVIFKNQARDVNENPKKEFVNDLLRTEFHRRFLKKFIA